ncbi:hypothetical protein CRUP_030235 [Coryphaenoides rupestris]|nr:hypothetical protein CRUP_030235 [Coryphaenoides rupestris]
MPTPLAATRIELGDVTPHNIKQLKRLNQVIFPVSYNDKFYKDVLEVGELAKLGTKMLNHVLNIFTCRSATSRPLTFTRSLAFEIIETKKNYYKRIEPADAHVLQKSLRSTLHASAGELQKQSSRAAVFASGIAVPTSIGKKKEL